MGQLKTLQGSIEYTVRSFCREFESGKRHIIPGFISCAKSLGKQLM